MLVLTRHVDEEIIIDGNIRVVVISVKGDKVRIGIDAPRGRSVHRKEIQEIIDRQKGGTDENY